MRFTLLDETRRVEEEVGRWATARRAALGTFGAFDEEGWLELTRFGLMHGTVDAMRDVDIATGMMAAAQGGLPGPVLEAELAVAAGSEHASRILRDGGVVTSVPPYGPARAIVGWGAVAELIVDQATGATLATGPLPEARTALPMGHGWLDLQANGDGDPLRARRWLLGSAIVTGLGLGALEISSAHVRTREQFGRTLSSFQAVQFRLAEACLLLEAAALTTLDAARRADANDRSAGIAAALAWLNADRVGGEVEKHFHQVLGAIGFTQELGVIRLTYQMAWLRSSIGRHDALAFLRDAQRSTGDPLPPASTVLNSLSAA